MEPTPRASAIVTARGRGSFGTLGVDPDMTLFEELFADQTKLIRDWVPCPGMAVEWLLTLAPARDEGRREYRLARMLACPLRVRSLPDP